MTAEHLRIALVLPGGLSFGAYEAGVCSALLEIIHNANGAIVLDHIVGSSCGSVTGLLTAAALRHEHLRPILEEVWVNRASLRHLIWPSTRMLSGWPLSTHRLEQWARDLFFSIRGEPLQSEPVRLTIATAPLNGVEVNVPVGVSSKGESVFHQAWSFRDIQSFVLGNYPTHWHNALDAVMASAAHPLVFSPRKLPRTPTSLVDSYSSDWFADGGASDNLPVHLALEGVDQSAVPFDRRLVIVVHEGFSPPKRIEEPTFWSTGWRCLYMLWKGPLLADLLRIRPLSVPMLLISPGESGLQGMNWGNLRGFFSSKARKADFEKGKRDFFEQWELSCWPEKISKMMAQDSSATSDLAA